MATGNSNIEVRPVNSRGDQKAFMRFPFDLYAGDQNWVPALQMTERELLNFKPHPFYEYANSAIQCFLAVQAGKIVGRIAAIVDGHHNEFHKEELLCYVQTMIRLKSPYRLNIRTAIT